MREATIDHTERLDRAPEGQLDVGALMRGIGRAKWRILGFAVLGFAIALAIVSVIKPRYTAEAKVFLDAQDSYFTRPGKDTLEPTQAPDPEAVQSQVQLVTSRDLARQAIRKLNLVGNPEFDPLANGLTLPTRLMVLFGLQRDPRDLSPEDRVLDYYYDRLTVYPVAKTRVLTVEFTSRDPDLAARGANTVAELYIDIQQEAKRGVAKAAGRWLAPNIDTLRAKVADAEAKVADFRAHSGLLMGNNNVTITAQQLADLSTQLSAARSTQTDAQAKAHLIRELLKQNRAAEVADIAKDDLTRAVAQQRVTLRAQLASESRTLLPGHPRIQELTAQLADVDGALKSAAEKSARSLENDARVAGARVDAMSAALEAQKKTVATGNGDEVQLRALERDATSARDQLESFLQKYRDATARNTDDAAPADARIISRAIAPELPSFPKKIPMLIIGTLAGLFLSFGVVVSRELLSGRPTPQSDPGEARRSQLVSRLTHPLRDVPSPSAAPAPAAPKASDDHVVDLDGGLAGNRELDGLAEVVRRAKPERHAVCVLVCGVDRASGGNAAAVELGRTLAEAGRAIIVDFDRGGPGLHRFIEDDEHSIGLADLVAGRGSFADIIHRDRASRLHVLPAGRGGWQDEGDAARLSLVIDALVATYDSVVLDGSPLADNDDSLDLGAWTDLTVLVTSRGKSDPDTVRATESLIEAGAVDVHVFAAPETRPTPAGTIAA